MTLSVYSKDGEQIVHHVMKSNLQAYRISEFMALILILQTILI